MELPAVCAMALPSGGLRAPVPTTASNIGPCVAFVNLWHDDFGISVARPPFVPAAPAVNRHIPAACLTPLLIAR